MGLDALLERMEHRAADTPETPCNPDRVSAKPAPILACTLDTPDTPRSVNLTHEAPNDGTRNTATASRWWLLHYADREPVEVACSPPATHAEILKRYPAAIAAEPFEPIRRQPDTRLTAADEATIRAWLAHIEEGDPAAIAETLEQCRTDADAREYFMRRAGEALPRSDAVVGRSVEGAVITSRKGCESDA